MHRNPCCESEVAIHVGTRCRLESRHLIYMPFSHAAASARCFRQTSAGGAGYAGGGRSTSGGPPRAAAACQPAADRRPFPRKTRSFISVIRERKRPVPPAEGKRGGNAAGDAIRLLRCAAGTTSDCTSSSFSVPEATGSSDEKEHRARFPPVPERENVNTFFLVLELDSASRPLHSEGRTRRAPQAPLSWKPEQAGHVSRVADATMSSWRPERHPRAPTSRHRSNAIAPPSSSAYCDSSPRPVWKCGVALLQGEGKRSGSGSLRRRLPL